MFLEWNAERLGIPLAESTRRYRSSLAVLPGGHTGRAFGKFNGVAHEIFRVFFDNRPQEMFDTYKYHGPMHFLVHLTYPEPQLAATDLIVKHLSKKSQVSILDFGCGLAQQSRTLAEYLHRNGVAVRLTLADVPTIAESFLLWWGRKSGIPTTFLACTNEVPIPELPECDYCQATEFFEHVYNPEDYFDRFDEKLVGGGLLITGIMDHFSDFMHVSPRLGGLRDRIRSRGYEVLVRDQVLRKPDVPAGVWLPPSPCS
jgi:cyclopropane fatty-acyl-phospholipid synthase-like methyltransferase